MVKAYSYIRFSTPEQSKGDSLRRQEDDAIEYAVENGLELDTTLQLYDKGVSAYDQSNKKKGALGKFLDAVKSGDVPRGSILLVETYDRLSRAAPIDALRTAFFDIIDQGITIITLDDRRVYNSETIKADSDLMRKVVDKVILAHEESARKSRRVRKALKNKREDVIAGKRIYGKHKHPHWVRPRTDTPNPGESHFELIGKYAEIVKRMFDMAKGTGAWNIMRTFNKERIENFCSVTDKKTWSQATIRQILTSCNAYGAFQSSTTNEQGKSILVGEPIRGYYPAVVSEDQFKLINLAMSERACRAGSGRSPCRGGKNAEVERDKDGKPILVESIDPKTGKPIIDEKTGKPVMVKVKIIDPVTGEPIKQRAIANVFSGFAYCGYCGHKMRIVTNTSKRTRTHPSTTYSSLVCQNGKEGIGGPDLPCFTMQWRTKDVEEWIFRFCSGELGFDLDELLNPSESRQGAIDAAAIVLMKSREELAQVEAALRNHLVLIDKGLASDTVAEHIEKLEAAKAAIKKRMIVEQVELDNARTAIENADNLKGTINQLRTEMDTLTGDDLYDLRWRLSKQLRLMFDSLTLYPGGNTVPKAKQLALEKLSPRSKAATELRQHYEEEYVMGNPNHKNRIMKIVLRSGVKIVIDDSEEFGLQAIRVDRQVDLTNEEDVIDAMNIVEPIPM